MLFSDKDVLHKHQDAALSYTAESFLRKSNVKHHIIIENMTIIFSGEKNINPYSVDEPSFTQCKIQLLI